MAFARPLADPGEHRDALVALDHGMDQLHDEHGLADPGAAEHCRLAALRQRRQQVDHLDAGREDFRRTALRGKRRRAAMNRAARHIGSKWLALVANRTGKVEQAAEHRLADRHLERPAGGVGDDATPQSCRRLQRDGANRRLVQMRLHLGDDRGALVGRDDQSIIDRRQCRAIEGNVQHRPAHRGHPAISCSCLFHCVFLKVVFPTAVRHTGWALQRKILRPTCVEHNPARFACTFYEGLPERRFAFSVSDGPDSGPRAPAGMTPVLIRQWRLLRLRCRLEPRLGSPDC